VKCHGADGTGSQARDSLSAIPDFTKASWQKRRSDAQLRASILDGKGQDMPAWRGKVGEELARGLVAHVRAFAPTAAKSGPRQLEKAALANFDERYHRLEQEMDGLHRQFREVSQATPSGAPSKASQTGQQDVARPSAPAEAGAPAVVELFRKRCMKCHGADGTGKKARERLPEIPDFTTPSWQARRVDSKLVASILDGKGEDMPAQRGKISEEQARSLVKYVRAFAATKGNSKQGKHERPTPSTKPTSDPPSSSLEKRQPSAPPASRAQASSSQTVQSTVPGQTASSGPGTSNAVGLYRRLCVKCHGADGTGNKARERLPEIPDFTNPSWQTRRAHSKLLASILDGKGEEMPAWRGKISEEQARELATHIRAFAPTTQSGGGAEREAIPGAEPGGDEPPKTFLVKLIRWLGKFHPSAVHFPIALLMAAAVAELLRIATGKPAFDAITRYCVWFGTLTAVGAGTLGWFLGGFRLTDASWVLMTHRWLGTSTFVCAGLVLVLSEASRRPERRGTRICFRAALVAIAALVSVTGFFGGAVVFGLKHYSWPQ
jgi:mono/diheme cytochrome c family protein/uncharacterized membrane protein